MSNVMRHRYGAKNPVLAEVASGTVVEVGDLVSLISGEIKTPAQTGATSASISDQAETFLGVAMQASASGETNPLRVATTGVFEYPCASASVQLGYYAALASVDQQVVATDTLSSICIGNAMPNDTGGVSAGNHTSVLVNINARVLSMASLDA